MQKKIVKKTIMNKIFETSKETDKLKYFFFSEGDGIWLRHILQIFWMPLKFLNVCTEFMAIWHRLQIIIEKWSYF